MDEERNEATRDDDTRKKDCEVCKRLMKEKHAYDILWKVFAILFLASTIVFAVLYFTSGALTTNTNITVENSDIGNVVDGDGTASGENNIIIGDGEINSGQVEKDNRIPIICISIVAGAVILTAGVIIVALYFQKNN